MREHATDLVPIAERGAFLRTPGAPVMTASPLFGAAVGVIMCQYEDRHLDAAAQIPAVGQGERPARDPAGVGDIGGVDLQRADGGTAVAGRGIEAPGSLDLVDSGDRGGQGIGLDIGQRDVDRQKKRGYGEHVGTSLTGFGHAPSRANGVGAFFVITNPIGPITLPPLEKMLPFPFSRSNE